MSDMRALGDRLREDLLPRSVPLDNPEEPLEAWTTEDEIAFIAAPAAEHETREAGRLIRERLRAFLRRTRYGLLDRSRVMAQVLLRLEALEASA